MQEFTDSLDGLGARCVYLLQRSLCGLRCVYDAVRSFHVGAVSALVTQNNGVLAAIGQQHELMRYAAAHHTGVGLYRDNFRHACAAIDVDVCLIALLIVCFQILLRGMEGICVLHRELTHTNQTAAGARLITELGLNLIDHKRILRIRLRRTACQMDSRLLVRHAQNNRLTASVLKTSHFAADGFIAAGFLPQGCRHNNRKHHFLSVDLVHFIADDVFNLLADTLCRHKQGINTGGQLLHIAAANHELVTV